MRLDDRYRIPLYLRWVEELPVKAIARMMDLPPKTVYTNLSRGKAILIKMLEEDA
jgi:DNA-directed RNA polymerase specialized sigma24 family protein